MADAEQQELEKEGARGIEKPKKGFYIQPWASEEYHVLRLPLLVGFAFALVYSIWVLSQSVFANVEFSFANIVPLLYPVIALVTTVTLYLRAYFVEHAFTLPRHEKWASAIVLVLVAACAGAFFAGGSSQNSTNTIDSQSIGVDAPISQSHARLLWNARCATCHGVKGNFNEKFVREFYPVPQKLDTQRFDSLGADSLVKVILNGRNNMNAYAGRLTPGEALGLANYMQTLAKEIDESAKEGNNDSAR